MIIVAVFTAKILQRVDTGKKIIKLVQISVFFFLPTAKYNLDLRARKIKRITTLKRAMTRGNVLACKTIFLNTAVSYENLLLLITSIVFFSTLPLFIQSTQ